MIEGTSLSITLRLFLSIFVAFKVMVLAAFHNSLPWQVWMKPVLQRSVSGDLGIIFEWIEFCKTWA
jgi:hypothetical protein